MKRTDRQIYEAISLGMSRTEVRRIAGPPFLALEHEVYYGGAPEIENWQRQTTPATVRIIFSADNRVVKKVFNDGKLVLHEAVPGMND